jgi:hypothetical protein
MSLSRINTWVWSKLRQRDWPSFMWTWLRCYCSFYLTPCGDQRWPSPPNCREGRGAGVRRVCHLPGALSVWVGCDELRECSRRQCVLCASLPGSCISWSAAAVDVEKALYECICVVCCRHFPTNSQWGRPKRRGQMVSTRAQHLIHSGFKSRPADRLSSLWIFVVFSVSPAKWRDRISKDMTASFHTHSN